MFDTEALAALGLWGLFLAAFFAGTVIAFGSEVVLIAVLLLGVSSSAAVAVASAGNTLGALTVHAIGRGLVASDRRRRWILERRWLARLQEADPEKLERALAIVRRWGPPSLLLSWLPFVGDVLVLASGLARLGLGRVIFFVATGKVARYSALAWAVLVLR